MKLSFTTSQSVAQRGRGTTRETTMRVRSAASLVAAVALLLTDVVCAGDSADSTIVMTMTSESIELTVPASAISLRIPKGDLAPVEETKTGAQTNPRYFHLQDSSRGLVVSGWFEPASAFQGFEAFWLGEFSAMKRSGMVPTAPPTSVAVGNWSGAAYEIALPSWVGKGVNTHIRAELIQAGTWVDLHISITSPGPVVDARDEALEFLKSIVVTEKKR